MYHLHIEYVDPLGKGHHELFKLHWALYIQILILSGKMLIHVYIMKNQLRIPKKMS